MNRQMLISKLREAGLKATAQRLEICRLILQSKDHPTAERIFQKMRGRFPTISLATVYQTLHLLMELGLLQELGLPSMSTRYDPNITPHINVICQRCGRIYDYEAEKVKETWNRLVSDIRIKTQGQRLDLYSYCEKCSI